MFCKNRCGGIIDYVIILSPVFIPYFFLKIKKFFKK